MSSHIIKIAITIIKIRIVHNQKHVKEQGNGQIFPQ